MLKVSVERFFDLFLKELEEHPALRQYYKFLNNQSSFHFRKAYFCQRLEFIADNLGSTEADIWDCGCGYGTTDIFLALNGYKVHGTTLEFYYKEIPKRLEYWKKHGDVSLFTYSYENLFDAEYSAEQNDVIIIQDTLHHLEPLQDALQIFNRSLKSTGKLIVVEENGSNIIQNLKLYIQRGSKRIIEIYDEQLQKNILLGNENIRSLEEWMNELEKQNLEIDSSKTEYIRFFPPFLLSDSNIEKRLDQEQKLWRKNSLLKKNLFFGLNFIAHKKQ